MDEAAELMRILRRALQELVKRYPFYYPNGKRKLFTESDIENLRTALRQEADPQRGEASRGFRLTGVNSQIGQTIGLKPGAAWAEVQRLDQCGEIVGPDI